MCMGQGSAENIFKKICPTSCRSHYFNNEIIKFIKNTICVY